MRTAFVLICASLLLFAFTSPLMAENVKMKENPKCKNWNSMIGTWKIEEQRRLNPEEEWFNVSNQFKFEWILGGSFIQIAFHEKTDVGELSGVEISGYDEGMSTHFSSFFSSDGSSGGVTSGDWDDTTYAVNWTTYNPDGTRIVGRCNWKQAPDFKSTTGICDRFTDGKWWTFRKAKGNKVK